MSYLLGYVIFLGIVVLIIRIVKWIVKVIKMVMNPHKF